MCTRDATTPCTPDFFSACNDCNMVAQAPWTYSFQDVPTATMMAAASIGPSSHDPGHSSQGTAPSPIEYLRIPLRRAIASVFAFEPEMDY